MTLISDVIHDTVTTDICVHYVLLSGYQAFCYPQTFKVNSRM
jgi:hypothetical protein